MLPRGASQRSFGLPDFVENKRYEGELTVFPGYWESGVYKIACADAADCEKKRGRQRAFSAVVINPVAADPVDPRHDARFAAQLRATDPQVLFLAAVQYQNDGVPDRARTLYDLILKKFPKHATAVYAAQRLRAMGPVD